MKAQRGKDVFYKGRGFAKRVDTFFRTNNYLITLLLCFFILYEINHNNTFRENASQQWEKELFMLKRNLGKVHFLTASGQHIVGEKHVIQYADKRFKDYLKNLIVDNTIFGSMKLTKGFAVKFSSAADILAKTEKMKNFEETFFHADQTLLSLYRQGLYRAIWDGRLPEYLEVSDVRMQNYLTSKNEHGYNMLQGDIEVAVLVKSYIKELNLWDNRKTKITIPFKAYIDIEKFAAIENPFGLNIYKLEIPVVHKPRADSLKK